MSSISDLQHMVLLWQYFLEDNLDAFRQYLADATFDGGSTRRAGSHAVHKASSPALPSTSPKNAFMNNRKSSENTTKAVRHLSKQDHRLTRADVNARDAYGRTLLHHAASSSSANALGFVESLLQIPFIDLYIQDLESGWTPLHRALYHGHVRIAQALMLRDIHNLNDFTPNLAHHVTGGLIKIKDHEGNSPFEVFGLTIASRDLQHSSMALPTLGVEDSSSVHSMDAEDSDNPDRVPRGTVKPKVNLLGDEVFAFGSNKNLSLGLGDEDDRQFPEHVTLKRPEQLLHRLHTDAQAKRSKESGNQDLSFSQIMVRDESSLPAVIRNQRIVIQDVVMSKLHTAVITNDPESNVYACGFGPGGRLGTGDESTRFSYVCLQTGGLSKKHVVVVALGQDHSIAVCEQGEVFTWGSNRFGQLGYSLPQSSSNSKDNPMQLTPRQLFGTMKKETVIGAAASSLHSAIFTSSALYTFGKNEGQLGLMDADARSLEMQVIPRRVGVSILQSPILMVSAIDRATIILLESHEVVVLTHYGWTKVVFGLESFTNSFLQGRSATRYDPAGNLITKITSGGNTICAMSTFGEVFTVDVSKKPDPLATNQSTTNPSKARNALPQPSRLWSIGKSHMAASDVAVGQDGSIILCTVSGSVWRKEKRAKIKEITTKGSAARMKDYKFARIPNINRAVGVRSNAYGSYVAIRKECDVLRQQIVVDPQSIWDTMLTMLPFRDLGSHDDEDSDAENPKPRFWTPATSSSSPVHVKQAVLASQDIESQVQDLMQKYQPLAESPYDLWITSTVSDVRIPAHSFLVKARSHVIRHALADFQKTYYFSIPDVVSIEYGPDGHVHMVFPGADFLTVLNYVFYLYTENVVDVWHHTQRRPHMAARYRQVRTELMKIAGSLEMSCLERAARVMTEPAKCLHLDIETAYRDPGFFTDADVRIELANDCEIPAHSALLSHRCPFFEGLFRGRAGGLWLSPRRDKAEENSELIRVDLKHVDEQIFGIVLRHIYADAGEELFDDVVTADLDEFIDLIIEVMAVANELMLDRLTQICQKMLGQYVTTRNVCQLLNAVAPCSVNEFIHTGLEYICLNLETMLEHRLLEELDDDLLAELDEMVQENQLACLPFVKSGRAEAELFDQHPELVTQIDHGKQKIIDSLRLRSRLLESENRIESAQKARADGSARAGPTSASPAMKPSTIGDRQHNRASLVSKHQGQAMEMLFEMDEEHPRKKSVDSSLVSPETMHLEEEAMLDTTSPLFHRQRKLHEPKGNVGLGSSGPHAESAGSSFHNSSYTGPPGGKRSDVAVASSIGEEAHNEPWLNTLAGSAKTDFKNIMAQASASRISNLTLALSNKDKQAGKAPQKLSQRERKKIQHQQSQEEVRSPSHKVLTKFNQSISTNSPKSPWQTLSKTPKPSTAEARSPTDSLSAQASPRNIMTMRQTVAGAPVGPNLTTPAKPGPQSRSVSSPAIAQSSVPKPQIQSIRHTPVTPTFSSSPLGAYSMADILAQQKSEKAAIKEAAAKRSLQEIQQEQEFQEWWDNESRRVQEEEQASSAANARGNKAGKGRRGGGRRKGTGRGGTVTSATEPDKGRVGTEGPSRSNDNARGSSQTRRGRGQRGQTRGH